MNAQTTLIPWLADDKRHALLADAERWRLVRQATGQCTPRAPLVVGGAASVVAGAVRAANLLRWRPAGRSVPGSAVAQD